MGVKGLNNPLLSAPFLVERIDDKFFPYAK